MHKKHRTHHHHKNKHISKSKKHHQSGHKHEKSHEDHHVSFETPKKTHKVDNNACGDFERNPSTEEKHRERSSKNNKIDDEKPENIEKYLRHLTTLGPENINKHSSVNVQTGSLLEKTKKIFKREKSLIEPTNIVEEPNQVVVNFKSTHKNYRDKNKNETKHKENHEHRKKSERPKDTAEHRRHKHKIPDNTRDKKYQGTVQEVLFYQVSPTPYTIKHEKPQNEIKDLYHRNDKAKSQERQTEKEKEHRRRSTKEDLCHRSDKVKSQERQAEKEKEYKRRSTKEDFYQRSDKAKSQERQTEKEKEHRHKSSTVKESHRHKSIREDKIRSTENQRVPSKAKDEKIRHKSSEKHELESSRRKLKEKRHEKIEFNNIKDTKEYEKKKINKELAMSTADITDSFQAKIENDMKNYFCKIQTMIDKKFEFILKNSRLKVQESHKNEEDGNKIPQSNKIIKVKKNRRSKSEENDHKNVENYCQDTPAVKCKLRNKIRPETYHHKKHYDETNIDTDKKESRPDRCYKMKECSVTFDKEKPHVHKKRKLRLPKGESEDTMQISVQSKPQESTSGSQPKSVLSCASEGLSKMTNQTDQSKFTNYSFRHPEPPYEWIFPPELWNLKIQDLILASQNKQFSMPPVYFKSSSGDQLKQKCPSSSDHKLPHLTVRDKNHDTQSPKSDFIVCGIEPPCLDSGRKSKKKEFDKKLECKTVSVIAIQPQTQVRELKITNESETQRTPSSASDEMVEKRKKSKRFKIYYKYSVEDNLQNLNNEACSSGGRSVVSDSYKVVNDPTEEKCQEPNKTKILEQQLVQNIFIKPQENLPKIRKVVTPIQSTLNNIIEEPTNSSGTSVNECYFKGLSTSNSESCLKIDKKPANSSISVRSKPPTIKICKYCKHNVRSKSDIKITSRATSRIYKSKSDVVINPSNAKQVVKSILLADGHPFAKSRVSKRKLQKENIQTSVRKNNIKPTDQGCQTSDYKVTEEEEIKDKEAYEEKKKHFREIYKTLDHLESGIQTVSQKFSSKKIYVDAGIGSEIFLENCKDHHKNIEEVTNANVTLNTPKKKKVKVKDVATGVSDDDVGASPPTYPKNELRSTGCSPICIRGCKSPTRSQPKTPAVNQRHTTRKVDTSPPKPVPRQSVPSRSVPVRKSVIPPTQVIVLRNSKTSCGVRAQEQEKECRMGTKTAKVHPEWIPKNTPRCSRGREAGRPRTVQQPSNVEELLRDVIEEQRRVEAKEKIRAETSVGAGDKIGASSKPLRPRFEECRPAAKSPALRQTRPPSCVMPSTPKATPVARQNTDVGKLNETRQPTCVVPSTPRATPVTRQNTDVGKATDNTVYETRPKQLILKKKRFVTPEGCLHVFSPERNKAEVDNDCQKKFVSINTVKLESQNPCYVTKRTSGSTSSSVSDTAVQIPQMENREQPLRRSQSLVDIETYVKNTVAVQEPQIYSQTEAILLTTQQIKSRLEKFITEPQSRWCRAKSNVQSLDQYDEKYKSTMLLTKQDKIRGVSSYQKRKTYDAFRRQKIRNNISSSLAQQVYYNINNIVNQQHLYSFDEDKKKIILRNPVLNLETTSFRKTPQDSALGSTIENLQENIILKPERLDPTELVPKEPSIVTLFVKKYDNNHLKLYNFCQKLLQVNSSMEFPFNVNETCSCKEISDNCQACNEFIQNLGVLFTKSSLHPHHKDDMPEFVNHFSNVFVNLDNEVCEFYNNEDFNTESLVDENSLKSDDHDSVTTKMFYPDDIQQETMTEICEELFPGKFNNVIMSKYVVEESDHCVEFSSLGQPMSVAHPISCPILQDNRTNFEYLYDENDSSCTSRENVFSNAFNLNLNQYNVETPPFFENIVGSRDTSESSGYESVDSKPKIKTVSHTNFFKKPKIAALFKPYALNKKKSDVTKYTECSSLECKESIHEQMVKNCQIYARKIRECKESKGNIFEDFKEFPLNILLNQEHVLIFEEQYLPSEIKITKDPDVEEEINDTKIEEISHSEKENFSKNATKYILLQESKNTQLEEISEDTETFGENNPFMEENETDVAKDFCSKTGCNVVLSNDVLKVESVTYFVPEIFLEPEHLLNQEYNNISDEYFVEEIFLGDLTKIIPKNVSSDQVIAKKFLDSLLNAYDVESEICKKIYEDQHFLSTYVVPVLEKRKFKEKKAKKKGFSCLFRRKSFENSSCTEEIIDLVIPPNEGYQLKLQELSSHARKCFSMLVDAVKRNRNIDDDQIKFCGILKMLERIENGDFQIMKQKDDPSTVEETVKNQVIESFVNVYEICQKEAKKHKRNLGDTELNIIKAFVSKFKAGLLSKTNIVAAYIGRGQIQSESQLKAAVTFLMRSNSEEINPKEFEEYCEINQNFKK